VTVEQSSPVYGLAPSQTPKTIRPAPITRISTSPNSQPGMRPSSPTIRTSCQSCAGAKYDADHNPHQNWPRSPAQGSRRVGGVQPTSQPTSRAHRTSGKWPSTKPTHARSSAARCLRTPARTSAPTAPRKPVKAANSVKKTPRYLLARVSHARTTLAVFLHIPEIRNSTFLVSGGACGSSV
jgi:hypothetical protein